VLLFHHISRPNCTIAEKVCSTYSLFTWSKQKWPFGGPAFIQPIRTIWKVFKKPWMARKKLALQKITFVL